MGDGPLFSLPFAALVRGARKPIAVAQSGTVFARLHGRPRTPLEAAKIVAFGNPEPLAEPSSPLPWARRELERVAELFGERATVFYGRGATEERVRATAGEADYLHFATHAVLDRRLPLESALALALPGGRTRAASADDGSLRGWEIAEQLDLHADLVTLSACSSALGGELAGEGITGLARAFQYAGARSLLVSLWDVSDRSTAELMERFYEGLRRGESKSGALLAAQASLLSQPQTAHPFHWAAFELLGDWE
ncbi:MAG: CHAT domain-containing protein [Thermoanaerobaculia bacterium]